MSYLRERCKLPSDLEDDFRSETPPRTGEVGYFQKSYYSVWADSNGTLRRRNPLGLWTGTAGHGLRLSPNVDVRNWRSTLWWRASWKKGSSKTLPTIARPSTSTVEPVSSGKKTSATPARRETMLNVAKLKYVTARRLRKPNRTDMGDGSRRNV